MDITYENYVAQNLTVYEKFALAAEEYKKTVAIRFYGKRFTYQAVMEKIEEYAKALVAFGVKENDVVASSLPGCPEGVFLIYAINKIGAIYCAFDCRSRKSEIRETIETFRPKVCFIPDFLIKELEGIDNTTIVHVSIVNSLNRFVKFGCEFANVFKGRTALCHRQKNFMSFACFLSFAKQVNMAPVVRNSNDRFGYFYTSGTTYGRKSIILTNENINAAVYQHKIGNPMLQSGRTVMNIMPLFTCYSVTLATHFPLILGIEVIIVPLLNPKKMKQMLLREKPNYIITVPGHWEHFSKQTFNNVDFSFLKCVVIGGDVMHERVRNRLDEIFIATGSGDPIVVGYGLSETTSTATTTMNAPKGSVGFPMINTKVAIFNSETLEQLPPFEKGEICISGPTVCDGYFHDPVMTQSLLKMHPDGRLWLHSGDCGYVDDSGAVYFCERFKRMYVRFDGTKVSPYSLEQMIERCSVVERCMVMSIPDPEHTHGKSAKAIVILKENTDASLGKKMVEKFIKENVDEHLQPKELMFTDRFTYTKNGKLDYFRE